MPLAAQIVFALLMPALILYGVRRVKVLEFVGATLLCYIVGILLANLPVPIDEAVSMRTSEAAVLLAIPLLLFSTDFVRWLRLARPTVLSFILALASVLVVATAGSVVFAAHVPEAQKLAGMFVGVYTGGTANMSAIGLALGVQEEVFIMVNAADVVMGGLYLIFLFTVAQRLLLKFAPPFKPAPANEAPQQSQEGAKARPAVEAGDVGRPAAEAGDVGRPSTGGLLSRAGQAGAALALSAAVVAVSVGVSLAVTGGLDQTLILLLLTTLSIAGSFVSRIRNLRGAFETGNYLLLVFCVAIGTIADLGRLGGTPYIFGYCAFVLVGTVVLHYALAARLGIDADTIIITSTAAVYSPAFVGPVAAALKNREVIVSGITTGLVGFAVGNYLGLALAYLLMG
mgnify:CR=1 FL=1